MRDRFMMFLGSIATAAMMVVALWGWQHAATLVADTARPDVALWAVRSGAVCVAAAAQVVLLACVVEAVYRRDLFGDVMKLCAALLFTVALVGAIALGVAAR